MVATRIPPRLAGTAFAVTLIALLVHNVLHAAGAQVVGGSSARVRVRPRSLENAASAMAQARVQNFGVYYLLAEQIDGATVVVAPSLHRVHVWYLENVSRLVVEKAAHETEVDAELARRLRSRGVRRQLRTRGQIEPIDVVVEPGTARYAMVRVAGEAGVLVVPARLVQTSASLRPR